MQLKNLKRREFIRIGGFSIAGSILIPSIFRKSSDLCDKNKLFWDIDRNDMFSKSNVLQNDMGVDILTKKGEQILV